MPVFTKGTAVKPDWIKRNKPLDFFQSNPDEKTVTDTV